MLAALEAGIRRGRQARREIAFIHDLSEDNCQEGDAATVVLDFSTKSPSDWALVGREYREESEIGFRLCL